MKPSALFISFFCFCTIAGTAYASGPYVVDDGRIVEAGKIQNEFWFTHSDKDGNTGVADIAYQLLPDAEFMLQVARDEQKFSRNTLASPQVKYVWLGGADKNYSGSLVVGGGYAFDQPQTHGFYAYVPTTFDISKNLSVNFDIGWQYTEPNASHAATFGAGVEYLIAGPLWFYASVFDRTDNHQGFQAGPHAEIYNNVRLDLVYGHNVTGQSENSGTLSATIVY